MTKVGKKAEDLNRPLYVAPKREKKKMPENVKNYLRCVSSGNPKGDCRKKFMRRTDDAKEG